jgi:hypothetical protein
MISKLNKKMMAFERRAIARELSFASFILTYLLDLDNKNQFSPYCILLYLNWRQS